MKGKIILMSFFLLLIFNSCNSIYQLTYQDHDRIQESVENILKEVAVENEYEYDLLYDGLRNLVIYIVQIKGDEILNDIESLNSIDEFRTFIINTFNKTPKEFAVSIIRHWQKNTNYNYSVNNDKFMEIETDHFIIQTFKDTKAYRDLDKISYLVEKYLENIFNFIDADEKTLANFYQNLSKLERGKILLILPPDYGYWNKWKSSLAFMSFGGGYEEEEGLTITIKIGIPYFNSLSSAALTHEIAHMVDLLFKIKIPDNLNNMESDNEKEFNEFFNYIMKDIFPHDSPWGEGFADYISNKFSIFHNKNLVLPPEDRLKHMNNRMKLINNILTTPIDRIKYNHILQYTELHSLVTYLIDMYGKEKFLDFYFSVPLSEDTFIKVYNKKYREIEKEWKEYYDLK